MKIKDSIKQKMNINKLKTVDVLIEDERLRSPKGGVHVKGNFYPGGQFIPSSEDQEAARKAIAEKKKENIQEEKGEKQGEAKAKKPINKKDLMDKWKARLKELLKEPEIVNWDPARKKALQDADKFVRMGQIKRDTREAVKRLYDELIPRLGVNINNITFSNERITIDPSSEEGLKKAKQYGIPQEEIDDAIKTGERFQIFGSHELSYSESGERQSEIKIFPDATPEDVYHEFVHAVELQGGLKGWKGTPEEHARILQKIFSNKQEEVFSQFTKVGSTVGKVTASDSDPNADILYSARSWQDTDIGKLRKALLKEGYDKQYVDKWIDDTNNVCKVVLDNSDLLDYESNPDEGVTALKPNTDAYYKLSLDFSTICKKSAKLMATIGETQKLLGRALGAFEWLQVKAELKKAGDRVSCMMCYVFSRKMTIGSSLNKLRELYPNVPADVINDITRHGELKNYKTTQEEAEAIAKYATENAPPDQKKKGYLMTPEQALKKYPTAHAWLKGRGAGAGKFFEARTDYRQEILKISQGQVSQMNKLSGLRNQSWSDFEAVHLIDKMQSTLDAAVKKLAMHSYTKMPEYAEIAAPTGECVNLSLVPKGIGLDDQGKLIFDDIEGMPADKAIDLRKRHKTAGTILVGTSDDHIRAAMKDPHIDYIIPYHSSGMKHDYGQFAGMQGWDDYEKEDENGRRPQSEYVKDQDKFDAYMVWKKSQGMTSKQTEVRPWEYWDANKTGDENAKMYLAWCEKNGIYPKFEKFKDDPGYWKLLVDRRMYDNDGKYIDQQPVKPTFNMDFINQFLKDVVSGKQEPHGDHTPNVSVAKKMAEEFKGNVPDDETDLLEVMEQEKEQKKAKKKKKSKDASPFNRKINISLFKKRVRDAFKEQEHPRGQPENAGQFVAKGKGTASKKTKTVKHLFGSEEHRAKKPLSGTVNNKSEGFNKEEILIANKTSRASGAVGAKAITPRQVAIVAKPTDTILDFGAGKAAAHTKALKELGLNVTAYEFGDNVVEGLHDANALSKKYDIVYASNVLNVQSSESMLRKTLEQIKSASQENGKVIFNYPQSPRKSDMAAKDVSMIIKDVFGDNPAIVGGNASAPLWQVINKGKHQDSKDISNDKRAINMSRLKKRMKDAVMHAPKGGVTLKGKKFIGGQFIPKEGGYQEAFLKMKKSGGITEQGKEGQQKKNNSNKKEPAAGIKEINIQGYSNNAEEITPEQRMQQAEYGDIVAKASSNINEIKDQHSVNKQVKVKGPLSSENAKSIRSNLRNEAETYNKYLATDTGLRLRDFTDFYYSMMKDALKDGSLKDIDSESINKLGIDCIQKLIHQEVESNRQMFTDHGIRHIVGDAKRAYDIAKILNPNLTGKEALLLNFIAVNHDVGYTVPLIRAGGRRSVDISKDHPKFSEKIARQQASLWNQGKVFSKEEYEKALHVISSHDSTELDKNDVIGTSMRLADNLSLFDSEKLPSAFRYIQGGGNLLMKMGIAAKYKNQKNFDKYKKELHEKISASNINENLKRDLMAATNEISLLTPKFTMGVLAGEINDINNKQGKLNIVVKYDKYDHFLQKLFDMGQGQTKKLLKDYGITKYDKSSYRLGDFVQLKVIGAPVSNKAKKEI